MVQPAKNPPAMQETWVQSPGWEGPLKKGIATPPQYSGLVNSMHFMMGFPGSSAGKEFACNAGDPSSIPESGRSTREGIGYPLQCSWASLVAKLVKNPLAMQETWVGKVPWRRESLPTPFF